ncbi:hypothetical protein [Jhaorihella thermophila]
MSRKRKTDASDERLGGAVPSFYHSIMQTQMAAISSLSWLGPSGPGPPVG